MMHHACCVMNTTARVKKMWQLRPPAIYAAWHRWKPLERGSRSDEFARVVTARRAQCLDPFGNLHRINHGSLNRISGSPHVSTRSLQCFDRAESGYEECKSHTARKLYLQRSKKCQKIDVYLLAAECFRRPLVSGT